MLLISCQLSTQATDTGKLFGPILTQFFCVKAASLSCLHHKMRQNWRRIFHPSPSSSFRNGIWARTPETLTLTLPQFTDLLKEIKCFALHESQREWHHGLAQVVFSTLQISSASLQCTRDAILNTCNLGAPYPLSKHILSTHPFQQQVLQTGK